MNLGNKNPLKVAIYSGTIPSTTFIERLIEGVSASGIEVLLFGQKQSSKKLKPRKNVTYYPTYQGYKKLIQVMILGGFLWLRKRDAKRKLDRYINSKSKNRRQALQYAAKYYPVLESQPDIFHLQWAKSISDWDWVQKFGIKLVVSLRGAHINYSPLANAKLADVYQKKFPLVDGFHGVSQAIINEAMNYGLIPSKAKVVYSGLDLKKFDFEPLEKKNERKIKLLSVGRTHWKKGYNYALQAVAILKSESIPFEYKIVGGSGEEELLFLREILNLNAEVEFLDRIAPEKVKQMMSESDIFLLPSVEEGIANVVLEAMAIGLPVISTNCGGMSEVIKHKENGWLIPVRNPELMAKAIQELISLNPNEHERMVNSARETIEKQHSKEQMVQGMISLYKNVEGL